MSLRPQRSDQFGAMTALTILFAVWLADARGVFRCADDYFGDLIGAQSADSFVPDDVLLVYADAGTVQSNDDRLLRLIQRIETYQPSQIGIACQISDQQRELLAKSATAERIVLGCTLAELTKGGQASEGTLLRQGFLDLQLQNQPVYRRHAVRMTDGQHRHDSLEACLAIAVLGNQARIPHGEFGIRFQGGARGLPHIHERSFADGTIVSELVAGRIVLIGQAQESGVGLVTPTTLGSDRMSPLELHGNILVTILRNNSIHQAGQLSALCLLFMVTVVSSQIFRQIRDRWLIRTVLAMLLAIGILCWGSTAMGSVQLPLSAMCSTIVLNFAGALNSRFQTLNRFFDDWSLLRHVNLKTARSKSYDEIWQLVGVSAQQSFEPTRIVVLELETGVPHLHVRATIECDESDIGERRRDVFRAPYRDAVQQRVHVDISERPFLNQVDGRIQFMVPLIYGADIQGVVLLEMEQRDVARIKNFDDDVTRFASEMGAYVAGLRERELAKQLTRRPTHRLRFLPEQIASRSLYQAEVEQCIYEQILQGEFDASEVAVAIGDVFGSLSATNEKMINHLQQMGINVDESDCRKVIASLTGLPDATCREMFRRCIEEGRNEQIILAAKDDQHAPGVLFLKQLKQSDPSPDRNHGVDNRWVSIQLVDAAMFSEMQHWQHQVSENQTAILHEQIARLNEVVSQMSGRQPDSEPSQYATLASELLESIEQCQLAINANVSDRPEQFFVADTGSILRNVVREYQQECEARGLQISSDLPVEDTQAVCNPILLRRILASILSCLMKDASRRTKIEIHTRGTADRIQYRFEIVTRQSDGALQESIGDRWQRHDAIVRGDAVSVLVGTHLEHFVQSGQWLKFWNGYLRCDCQSSYQLAIELDLARRFDPTEAQRSASSPPLIEERDDD